MREYLTGDEASVEEALARLALEKTKESAYCKTTELGKYDGTTYIIREYVHDNGDVIRYLLKTGKTQGVMFLEKTSVYESGYDTVLQYLREEFLGCLKKGD